MIAKIPGARRIARRERVRKSLPCFTHDGAHMLRFTAILVLPWLAAAAGCMSTRMHQQTHPNNERPTIKVEADWWSSEVSPDREIEEFQAKHQSDPVPSNPEIPLAEDTLQYSDGAAAQRGITPTLATQSQSSDDASEIDSQPSVYGQHAPIPQANPRHAQLYPWPTETGTPVSRAAFDQLGGEEFARELPPVQLKALMQDADGRRAAVIEIEGAGSHVCREADMIALPAVGDGVYIEIRHITNKNVVYAAYGSSKEYLVQ